MNIQVIYDDLLSPKSYIVKTDKQGKTTGTITGTNYRLVRAYNPKSGYYEVKLYRRTLGIFWVSTHVRGKALSSIYTQALQEI